MADTPALGAGSQKEWRFKSSPQHHEHAIGGQVLSLVSVSRSHCLLQTMCFPRARGRLRLRRRLRFRRGRRMKNRDGTMKGKVKVNVNGKPDGGVVLWFHS